MSFTNTSFYKALLGPMYGKSPFQRGLRAGNTVALFVCPEGSSEPQTVATATLCSIGVTEEHLLRRKLHGHQLPEDDESDLVVIRNVSVRQGAENVPYPYMYETTDDIPDLMSDMIPACFYVWDTRAMQPTTTVSAVAARSEPESGANSPSAMSDAHVRTPPKRRADVVDLNPARRKKTKMANRRVQPSAAVEKAKSSSPSPSSRAHGPTSATSAQVVPTEAERSMSPPSRVRPSSSLALDDSGVVVNMVKYDKRNYQFRPIWILLDQILEPACTLRDVDAQHVDNLAASIADTKGFDPAKGLLTVMCNASTNPNVGDAHRTIFDKRESQWRLRKHYFATLVDGVHRRLAAKQMQEQKGHSWTKHPLTVMLVTRVDGKDIGQSEAIKLSQNSNKASGIVRRDSHFLGLIQNVVRYAKAFTSDFGVDFTSARTADIVSDMQSSEFLGPMSLSSYTRYIRVAKFLVARPFVLPMLVSLSVPKSDVVDLEETEDVQGSRPEMSVARATASVLGLIHLDDKVLFTCSDETDIRMMLLAAHSYSSNKSMPAPFHAPSFYARAKALLESLRAVFNDTNHVETFAQFLKLKVNMRKNREVSSIETLFCNTMRLLQYNPRDRTGNWLLKAKSRESRLLTVVTNTLGVSVDDVGQQEQSASIRRAAPPPPPSLPTIATRRTRAQRAREEAPLVIDVDSPPQRRSGTDKEAPVLSRPHQQAAASRSNYSSSSSASAVIPTPSVHPSSPALQPFQDDVPQHASLSPSAPPSSPPSCSSASSTTKQTPSVPSWADILDSRAPMPFRKAQTRSVPAVSLRLSGMIPDVHRAHVLLRTGTNLECLRDAAWLLATKKALQEMQVDTVERPMDWMEVYQHMRKTAIGSAFWSGRRAELQHRGYTILDGMADPLHVLNATPHLVKQLQVPEWLQNNKNGIKALWAFVHKSFPGEDTLRDEANRSHWSPIVNVGVERRDEQDRNHGIGRYTTTWSFLMQYMESSEERRVLAKHRALLDVWLGWLGALLNLDKNGTEPVTMPSTGGRFLRTGKGCPPQCGHNDFAVEKSGQHGYFMITTSSEPVPLLVCPASHSYVHYPPSHHATLVAALKLETLTIPKDSVFVGHGHLQHAGAGFNGSACLRYHTYFKPKDMRLPDAVMFAYGNSLKIATFSSRDEPQKTTKPTEGEAHQQRDEKQEVSSEDNSMMALANAIPDD